VDATWLLELKSIGICKATRGVRRQRDAIDEVIVLEWAVLFVLDRGDLSLLYVLFRCIIIRCSVFKIGDLGYSNWRFLGGKACSELSAESSLSATTESSVLAGRGLCGYQSAHTLLERPK
jgi:hypothetical protein